MRVTSCGVLKWLIFGSCCMEKFVFIGLFFSIGTIFPDVMSTFNTSRAQTAVFHSTGMAVSFGSGLISGMLIYKFGVVLCGLAAASIASFGLIACYLATSTVYLTISYGIVQAFGMNLFHISSVTAAGQLFDGNRKLLMLSLQSSCVALGGMIYPYVLAYLSDIYGFRGALLIIGGFSLNCIPGCLLWTQIPNIHKERPRENLTSDLLQQYRQSLQIKLIREKDKITIKKKKELSENTKNDVFYIDKFPVLRTDSNTKIIFVEQGHIAKIPADNDTVRQTALQSLKSIIKNMQFMIFVVGCVAAYPSVGLVVIFVADVFRDKGLTLNDVTFSLLLMNIVNIFGRLLPGSIMQCKNVPTLFGPIFASVTATISLVGFSLHTSEGLTEAFLALAGIPIGMFMTMFSVISAKLVDPKDLPTAIGLIFTTNCIGNFVAGPIGGYIRDMSGSYSIPFQSAAGMTSFSTLLFIIAMTVQKMKNDHQRKKSSVFYLTSI